MLSEHQSVRRSTRVTKAPDRFKPEETAQPLPDDYFDDEDAMSGTCSDTENEESDTDDSFVCSDGETISMSEEGSEDESEVETESEDEE